MVRTLQNEGGEMKFVQVADPSGSGTWLLILGCPVEPSHILHDKNRTVSGPTFAICANCEHQKGINLEIHDFDSEWSNEIHPERLKCGYVVGAEKPSEGDQATERAC
jgi:hypothetical protein